MSSTFPFMLRSAASTDSILSSSASICEVGPGVGPGLGLAVGPGLGLVVGPGLGLVVGPGVGLVVGPGLGLPVGASVCVEGCSVSSRIDGDALYHADILIWSIEQLWTAFRQVL